MAYRSRTESALRWAALAAVLGLLPACSGRSSGSRPIGTPQSLEITPSAVMLRDATSTVQVTVTAITDTGRQIDFTASAEGTVYASSDPAVADVSSDGLVTTQGQGRATLTVTNGSLSQTAEIYSDLAPPLTEGDFDLGLGEGPIEKGKVVTIPLIAYSGGRTFGSYRVVITWDAAHFEFVKAEGGADLKAPLANRADTAGEVELVGAYAPALGQSLTGRIEAARIVLRAIGDSGLASTITGSVAGMSDDKFPALPIGSPVPRPFVSGVHWLAIE